MQIICHLQFHVFEVSSFNSKTQFIEGQITLLSESRWTISTIKSTFLQISTSVLCTAETKKISQQSSSSSRLLRFDRTWFSSIRLRSVVIIISITLPSRALSPIFLFLCFYPHLRWTLNCHHYLLSAVMVYFYFNSFKRSPRGTSNMLPWLREREVWRGWKFVCCCDVAFLKNEPYRIFKEICFTRLKNASLEGAVVVQGGRTYWDYKTTQRKERTGPRWEKSDW